MASIKIGLMAFILSRAILSFEITTAFPEIRFDCLIATFFPFLTFCFSSEIGSKNFISVFVHVFPNSSTFRLTIN